MYTRITGRWLLALSMVLLLLLTACGKTNESPAPGSSGSDPAQTPAGSGQTDTGAGSDPAAPAELTNLTMRFDYLLNAYSVPFLVAQEKGFFANHGLEVEFSEGKGSSGTAQAVGQGQFDFGLADAGAIAATISKGAPIKTVAGVLGQNTQGLVFISDKVSITSVADLKGKRGGYFQGAGSFTLLQALKGVSNLTDDDIIVRLMDGNARIPALLEGQVDFIGGTVDGDYLRALGANPAAKFISMYDLGLQLQGMSVVAHNDKIANQPDVVRAFVAASAEGWKYALENKEEAAEIAVKYFPEAQQERMLEGLKLDEDFLTTPNTEGKPFGWMSDTDWQVTVDVMHKYGGLENPLPLSEYFTNDFVPQQ